MGGKHEGCESCGELPDRSWGFSKYGSDDSQSLPAQARNLAVVRVIRGSRGSGRVRELWQCPSCRTFYHYRTDYEYLAGGSEDEEELTRISDDEARKL